MARYVDGFVVPVPTKNLKAYRRMAQLAGIWRAGEIECVADDVKPGKLVPRRIVWPSRQVGDAGMKKVMADPRLQPDLLYQEFTGQMMGQPFSGIGIDAYDNVRKRYVTGWIPWAQGSS